MDTTEQPTPDKFGEALNAQRFQMLEDIARELAGPVVFPTCFDAAIRLRKALQNPDLAIARVADVVSLEPLVASRLLQLAGSALYSPDGQPPRNLQAAITRLGIDLVRTTALGIAMNQLLRSKDMVIFADLTRMLWEHTLTAAAASRVVAREQSRVNPEEALLAGLVHDLGAFYMVYRAAQYDELRARPLTVKYLMVQWHESIGVSLLSALGLPEDIVDATIDHDQPRPLGDELRTLADVVYVGNALAGSHFDWFDHDTDADLGTVNTVREQYGALLPQIQADAAAMRAVFA